MKILFNRILTTQTPLYGIIPLENIQAYNAHGDEIVTEKVYNHSYVQTRSLF